MRRLFAIALSAAVLASFMPAAAGAQDVDLTTYVDPMIGTYAPGFVNPGPVLPHGMVGLGPDTEGPLNYGGYFVHNQTITGFSQTHMSAGVFYGGQLPFMPVSGPVRLEDPVFSRFSEGPKTPAYASPFDKATEVSEAGYYKVSLARYGIQAELTATTRAGMHRYTFPDGLPASVVIDASRDLSAYNQAEVKIVDDNTVIGSVSPSKPGGGFTLHFAARFSKPFQGEVFSGDATQAGVQQISGKKVGAILNFGDNADSVVAKVGLSYVDAAGAIGNLDAEIPDWDFDRVREDARAAWNRALGRIEVDGGTVADLTSFYTALYHAQLFPNVFNDVDGRYMGMDNVVRTTDRTQYSQFSLWDSYRGQNQLLSVINPDAYRDMVASLMDYYEQSGSLPRWVLANRRPDHMSGDPVIPFIGEAWCRGLVDAELQPKVFGAMRELTEARTEYINLGYNPTEKPANQVAYLEGGSGRTGTSLEYGIAEFALALMADSADYADRDELLGRADNYRNLLDPETRWIRPRHADGTWIDPFLPENDYGFQEGTSWQYSWLVMQDLAGLFERMGGNAAVNERLDTFFSFPASATVPAVPGKAQNQATAFGLVYRGNQYAPGNEHDLQAPFLYNYSGAPWKTQAVARAAASVYTPTVDGLPGNDDLGALSGWLVWTMLGAYPMTPGAPMYTVASPVFEKATIHRPGGTDLVIEAPGASPVNKYVQSATLDGEGLTKTWFNETQGNKLTVQMGPVPNTAWGSDPAAAPPSMSTDPSLDGFGCVADQEDAEPIATSLTYVGDTQGRGTTVRLAAQLLDASDTPIDGEAVSFELGGTTYTATTGPDGIAETTARIVGHGRSQQVTATYAGDGSYLGSSTSAQIVWGQGI